VRASDSQSRELPAAESAEELLIIRHFRALATDPGAFDLADDAAILTPRAGCDLVLKTDPIISGVHFFPDEQPEAVARKALRVNLSDLAAKGAEPAGFLMALALPESASEDWLARFARALGEDAEHYRCPLLGGDTDRTPGLLTVSITAFGTVPRGTMVRRCGARIGDRIMVTGTIGDAALGLELRRAGAGEPWAALAPDERAHLLARYQVPEPRINLSRALLAHASAAMDISDGLAGDLARMCRGSAVSAEVEVARVPLSAAARATLRVAPARIDTVLTGGDDYEVLCTVPAGKLEAFEQAAASSGTRVTSIGSITEGVGAPRFIDSSGATLVFRQASFSHF
jgi:thiamine-monophosphate kinase